jgi:hypothetical protein
MMFSNGTAVTPTEKSARVARMILGLYMFNQMWEVKDMRGRNSETYTCARPE